MSSAVTRRFWRPLLAVSAAAAVSLGAASLPSAVATTTTSAQLRDQTMYDISVRASDGDAVALAAG